MNIASKLIRRFTVPPVFAALLITTVYVASSRLLRSILAAPRVCFKCQSHIARPSTNEVRSDFGKAERRPCWKPPFGFRSHLDERKFVKTSPSANVSCAGSAISVASLSPNQNLNSTRVPYAEVVV